MSTLDSNELIIYMEKGCKLRRIYHNPSIGSANLSSRERFLQYFQGLGVLLYINCLVFQIGILVDIAFSNKPYYAFIPLISFFGVICLLIAVKRYSKLMLIPYFLFEFAATSIYLYIVLLSKADYDYYIHLDLAVFSQLFIFKFVLTGVVFSQMYMMIVVACDLCDKLLIRE
ncbi:unnamed protein product [Bursaphelenchus xylophilus]|uniref:(pine wood nematode) hypothetical protein n=1 Tax=Bursaphelenchus xylophilus TaxID=6326 RepID=A0A1I7RZS6_BURXY|nr:unnamed protein product [Bursaphelenchus xylophilus]CAG9111720.1 unnamed protein product [Bursaphelenchus xylophilus]